MKKLYALAGTLFIVATSIGQTSVSNIPASKERMQVITPAANPNVTHGFKTSHPHYAPAAVIWSDDFSTPANWTLANTSSPPWDWAIDVLTLPYVGIIASTSGGNFAGLDSDTPGNGATQNATITTANPINCTGFNNVQMTFEQNYMKFYDVTSIEVSNDGTNWTNIVVNGPLPVNGQTPNPDFVSVDVSAVADNQATVWVRFRYVGAWDYAWEVDDVALIETPNNDLNITTGFFNGTSAGTPTLGDSAETMYYSQVPLKHALLDTLFFGCSVSNQGILAQPNTKLDVNITGAGTYTGTSTPANLPVATTDFPEILTPYFIPIDTGMHVVDFAVSSDLVEDFPINNTLGAGIDGKTQFRVTDSTYARDNGVFGGGSWYGAGTEWKGGALFTINSTDTATSLAFAFHSATTDGALVNFHIYDGSLTTPIVSYNNFILTAALMSQWIVVPITETELAPGDYIVAFESFAGDDVVILTGSGAPSAPPLTTFVDVQNGGWGYAGFTPMIRLHTKSATCGTFSASLDSVVNESIGGAGDGSVTVIASGGAQPYTYNWSTGGTDATESGLGAGTYTCTVTDNKGCTQVIVGVIIVTSINEAALNATVAIFPNPSNGVFTIEFANAAGDDYKLEISNLLGQEVYNENIAIIGSFTKRLDLKAMEKGVYFLHVSNSASESTYKLVIE